ncbi:MAG: class I SAM-dependent methyltransferase [Nitrosopumilus sp.]|nr:class I SAM-dependent methyltransferase [Nitrosopumilus sp.]
MELFLWTIRKNENDVVNLYNSLSPVMQLATGGNMLNFGYWDKQHDTPISAQENLCNIFANMAELDSCKTVVDVGSGLSAPAIFWRNKFPNLSIFCVNINQDQLRFSAPQKKIEFFNSSSTKLPFTTKSVDRILALESSQHFKPLADFIYESKRILSDSGFLVLAIPVTLSSSSLTKLGILKFTWSSEHYALNEIKQIISSEGFQISEEKLIGSNVYDPLTNYYIEHREEIKKSILKQYSSYVEKILFKSLQKMKNASENKIIDYVLLKCHL